MADTKISGASAVIGTGVFSTPVAKGGSTSAFRHVDNISAATSPTATDDSADGYHAGSLWYRIDTHEMWVCRDATATAAVWLLIGAPLVQQYVAGNYYHFPFASGSDVTATVTAAADTLRAFPFVLPRRITVQNLWTRVGTQNGNWAFAIYNSNTSTLLPTTARASGTAAAVPAAGNGEFAMSSSTTLEPGVVYWAAINFSGSTATTSTLGSMAPMGRLVGSTLANIQGGSGQSLGAVSYATQTAGTWNDLTAVSPTNTLLGNAMHLIGFKCASVP